MIGTIGITNFLLARLDEDETAAEPGDHRDIVYVRAERNGFLIGGEAIEQRRILADIAAKRRIVERYQRAMTAAVEYDELEAETEALLAALLWPLWDLAAAYADHPDYDQEWRPA
jgi:hypothetical protein